MRHTGVTLMLEHGINPRVIQFLAGWTSLRMLERYGHVRDTEVRRAVTANADRLNAAATKTATAEKSAASNSEEVGSPQPADDRWVVWVTSPTGFDLVPC